jgi:hypothetical protein
MAPAVGAIPATISMAAALRHINLGGNSLSSTLPPLPRGLQLLNVRCVVGGDCVSQVWRSAAGLQPVPADLLDTPPSPPPLPPTRPSQLQQAVWRTRQPASRDLGRGRQQQRLHRVSQGGGVPGLAAQGGVHVSGQCTEPLLCPAPCPAARRSRLPALVRYTTLESFVASDNAFSGGVPGGRDAWVSAGRAASP